MAGLHARSSMIEKTAQVSEREGEIFVGCTIVRHKKVIVSRGSSCV
ncbi:MAG TPA: hypothetical protein VH413_12430 [Verrucomicrobiae bacterium]|nr:hypothetical protein [Verrucomicrobiae bacterium]